MLETNNDPRNTLTLPQGGARSPIERRTPNAERRTPNAERRTPNAERRTPNAERRTPNGRTPNAERRTPNAERRTPNAERRTPNAERRTPNAERRTPNAWKLRLNLVLARFFRAPLLANCQRNAQHSILTPISAVISPAPRMFRFAVLLLALAITGMPSLPAIAQPVGVGRRPGL